MNPGEMRLAKCIPTGLQLSTMKKKSKSIHFRANRQDQQRLAILRKKYDNNAAAIREALRCLAEKEGGK